MQWAILEKVAKFFEPFKELTVQMLSSSDSTAFLIILLFNLMIDHVEDMIDAEKGMSLILGLASIMNSILTYLLGSLLGAAAKEAREKLIQYYSKTNTILMLYIALDPRRKFYYFVKKEFADNEISVTKEL